MRAQPLSEHAPGGGHIAESAFRLRVLVVTVSASGVGGMQRHTHDLVRGLVEAGHDVEVVCPFGPDLTTDLYDAQWTLLDTTGRTDPEWPAKIIAAYHNAQARIPFDIVHSESTSAAPLARTRIETPIAVMYHGNFLGLTKAHVKRAVASPGTAPKEGFELIRLTWRYLRDRNAWGFRRCEAMVVSRQQLRDSARSSLTPLAQFHVVPNGVDTSLFRPGDRISARRSLGMSDGVVLATVGRLNRQKGFDVAMEAIARIATDHPEVRLLVVGDGEERTSLETLALRLGVGKRVDFVGPQPQARVAEYLVASDIFLFPTRANEAGPLVVPQALASGLPVIASRIGGVSEVLEPRNDGEVGILVRPGSVDELEAAIRHLIEDQPLRTSLGVAARALAVSEYSLETMIARTVAVYRAAIARAGRPR